MSTELELLSVLKNKDQYSAFAKHVDTNSLSDLARIVVNGLGKYFEAKPDVDEVEWGKFRTWLLIINSPGLSADKKILLGKLFDALDKAIPDEEMQEDLINTFITKDVCSEIATKIMSTSGHVDLNDIAELVNEGIERLKSSSSPVDEDVELEDLVTSLVTAGGYDLRLKGYKESIGKVRGGDMIVLIGRPESGKTSHALDQFVRPVLETDPTAMCLFFNNEEADNKIRLRAVQVALGKSGVDIAADVPKNKAAYDALFGKRFKVIGDHNMTVGSVEALCKKHKPKVIVFNVLDKVYGFTKTTSNDVERVRRLAQWARKLATTYDAIVICLGQADGSVEGERFFGQDKAYGSKTGVPGEADILICLGHSREPKEEGLRFINIAKNKTTGDSTTDPAKKHNQFPCSFDGSTGRYGDLKP